MLLCPDINSPKPELFSAPTAPPASTEGLYVVDLYEPDHEILQAQTEIRERTLVNAVSITASGTELAPEMLSLHPDFVDGFQQ